MKHLHAYLFVIYALTACASKSDNSTPPPASPSIAFAISAVWSASYPNWILNFTQATPTQGFIVTESFASGGSCWSFATMTQNQSDLSGTITLSNSTVQTNEPGMINCSYFDGDLTYQLNGAQLTLCGTNTGCVNLQ